MPTQIFQERIEDHRAWTADSIGQDRPWCLHLDQRVWDLIDPEVQAWRKDPQPITEVRLSETQCQVGGELLAEVMRMLEAGYGFVLLDRIPLDRYSHEEANWLTGSSDSSWGSPLSRTSKGRRFTMCATQGETSPRVPDSR